MHQGGMIGIVSGRRALSHTEIQDRIARAAGGLRALGVGQGDVVALILRNDIAFIEASEAIGRLGAYATPLNWHSTPAEAEYILQDCAPKALIAHADLLANLRGAIPPGTAILAVETPPEILQAYRGARAGPREGELVWESWLAAQQPLSVAVPSPGTMVYTSGTTGKPKGVRRFAPTPEQAKAGVELVATAYGLRPRDPPIVSLAAAPLYHSAPNMHALTSLRIGANIVIQPRFDPEETLALIEKHRVTHAYFAPIMFTRLLQLPRAVRERYDVSSLEHIVHAAAPCPPEIKRAMIEWWGPVVHEFFGSTECRTVTFVTASEWLERPGTVGRPLPQAALKILGPDGAEVKAGEEGEVVCGHPHLADFTYHQDDAKRRASDRGGLVATGDIGYVDEAGYLYLCDRSADMIISGGVNIYPAEIEAALLQAPGVFDCAVFGIPDEEFGESVMAVVQSANGATLDPEALKDFLRARIAGYKIPRRIEQAEHLPREESGKIFKRKLRDPFWADQKRRI